MPSAPDSPSTFPRLVGRAVERVEDAALLTGRGRFADDVGERPGTAHAAVLRSPHAHAEIVSLDAAAALSMPEVVTVLTGEEVAAWSRPFIAGVKQPMRHYALAVDRVRYTGEPVAVVVARDRYGAEDALERIEVEYRELDPVVDPVAAAAPDAPLLHREVGSNVVSDRRFRYGEQSHLALGPALHFESCRLAVTGLDRARRCNVVRRRPVAGVPRGCQACEEHCDRCGDSVVGRHRSSCSRPMEFQCVSTRGPIRIGPRGQRGFPGFVIQAPRRAAHPVLCAARMARNSASGFGSLVLGIGRASIHAPCPELSPREQFVRGVSLRPLLGRWVRYSLGCSCPSTACRNFAAHSSIALAFLDHVLFAPRCACAFRLLEVNVHFVRDRVADSENPVDCFRVREDIFLAQAEEGGDAKYLVLRLQTGRCQILDQLFDKPFSRTLAGEYRGKKFGSVPAPTPFRQSLRTSSRLIPSGQSLPEGRLESSA